MNGLTKVQHLHCATLSIPERRVHKACGYSTCTGAISVTGVQDWRRSLPRRTAHFCLYVAAMSVAFTRTFVHVFCYTTFFDQDEPINTQTKCSDYYIQVKPTILSPLVHCLHNAHQHHKPRRPYFAGVMFGSGPPFSPDVASLLRQGMWAASRLGHG